MKTYSHILLVILCIALEFAGAQDLIVTQHGDSLNCKITDMDREYIYFTYKNQNGIQKTLIKQSDAQAFRYNFFNEPAFTQEEVPEHFQYRISGGGGFAWLTADTKNSALPKSYVDELKSGYNIELDMAFFLTEQYALGGKFMSFFSGNSLDNISLTYPNGSVRYGTMEDNLSTYFFGPSFYSTSNLSDDGKVALTGSLALGYVSHNNTGMLIDPIEIHGSTVGFAASIGIDILSSNNFGFGIDLSVLSASITEYEVTYLGITQTVTPQEKDNISRIDLTFGLKFYK